MENPGLRFATASLAMAVAFSSAADAVYAPADASREVRFAHPPACARILPIRHNRPNDAAKAEAELKALKDEGFGGFVGNVNMSSNYLHDAESWQTFRDIVEKAHEMGMVLWLYDEKGYPSGPGGGLTLAGHPELQARAFLVSVTNEPGGVRRVTGVRDAYIYEGTHIAICKSKFRYDAYPNLLLSEATDRFIGATHEAYRCALGPALGYIDSTFTDEPSLMTLWKQPMPELCLPVSDELLAAYEAKFGHPLQDDVPALVTGEPIGKTAEIRHRYWTMVAERVAKNYTGRLTEWASANGILSGGHLLAEESLVAHVPLYGDFFRVLRGLSAPGCDMLTSIPETVNPIAPILAGSAGELNGAPRVMSEASEHRQRTRRPGDTRPPVPVTARQIVGSLNRQIWGGVNLFTSYYRWEVFSPDERRAINEEIGRTLTLTAEGRSAAEVALLYPADALMTGFEPQNRDAGGKLAQCVSDSFKKALSALFQKGRPFLVVDAQTLASAEVKDGALAYGSLAWRTVILPSAVTLPLGAARKLAVLQEAGGQVIALGERPVNSERAFPDAEIVSLAAKWTHLPQDLADRLPETIASRHRPPFTVTRGAGNVLRFAHRRTAKDGDVLFVANDSPAPWTGALRIAGDPEVRIWDPRSGRSHTAMGEISLELPPYAAVVLTTSAEMRGRMTQGGEPVHDQTSEGALPCPQDVPELLKTEKGERVRDATDWEKVRKPEILEFFRREVYGRRPVQRPPHLAFSSAAPDRVMMDGAAVRKRIRVEYGGSHGTNSFVFTAFVPTAAKRPAPSFVFICNRDPKENIDPERVNRSGFWPAEEIVRRGFAAIAFFNGDVTPDIEHGRRLGAFAAFEDVDRKYRSYDGWGVLSCWAWGASRVLDWIETEPSLDARHVAVIGHSRGGKTALVAAVEDPRFAMACSSCSGCGGAKLHHIDLPASETIAKSNRSRRFWYCNQYAMWANRDRELPYDQHEYVALIAPRLVCIGSATDDDQAGPLGEYWTARLASPVWELYGKKGLVSDAWPEPDAPQQEGSISYHRRTGKHDLTPSDWNVYMDFAARHGWLALDIGGDRPSRMPVK